MFKRVLFPVIMNEHTEQIINCLGGLAKNGVQEVLLFHVLSVSEMANGRISRKHDEDMLIRWKKILEETGIVADYRIMTGIPWLEIVEAADKNDFSFVLLGSHRNYYLDKVFFGSVTENVVHHSKKPIFIFKLKLNENEKSGPFCMDIFGKILYATDFSESSAECIPYIDEMLNSKNQEIIVLHVQDLRILKHVSAEKIDEFNRVDLERLEKLKQHFEKSGFKKVMTLLSTGFSIPEILNYIKTEGPTIVVMGKKGKSNLKEMLLGGVADTIIRKSEIPIFIVEGIKSV